MTTVAMFGEDAPAYGPALPDAPPFFLGDVATRKSGVPGWEWFSSRVVGADRDVFILEGGVPRILKSGPRKGQKTWDRKAATEVAVTRAEADAEAVAYEARTGKCRRCAGSKVHMTESSIDTGVTYSTCWRCKGTGEPIAEKTP